MGKTEAPTPQHRKPPPVTSGSLLVLVLTAADHNESRRTQQSHTADSEHPCAVAAGLGQVEAGVVNHGQGNDGVAIGHGDILAVDGGGGGQQLCAALLTLPVLSGLDNDLDRVPQQHIALVGGNFGQRIGIVLQPLDYDVATAIGNESGSVSFLCGKALGIIHAILLLRDDIAVVTVIVQPELHVPQVAAVIAELLEDVNAVGVDMAAVLEGIIVGIIRSAPRQFNLVGVVGISHLGIGGQGGGVGEAHGAVRVPTLHAVDVHGGRLVDLAQAGVGHTDSHNVLCILVSHGELAGILRPCGDLVGAASVLKELDSHIVLVILDALGHGTVGCFTGVGICGVCLGAPWVFFVGLMVGLRVLWLIPAVSGRAPLRCPVGPAAGTALRSCGIGLERGALVGVLADAGAGRTVFPTTVERAGPVFLLYRLSKAEVAVCCWAAEAVCCCAPACI